MIKKKSENVFEIEKEGKMLVPGIVFASDSLMDKIKLDKTLEQVKNVAMLPGIVEKSIAMPDAHQGYGFSVGGVAAFDVEKGIISPGGIGYDINCLTGDSKVLMEFGNSNKIEDFENVNSEVEIEESGRKIKQLRFNTQLQTLNYFSKSLENKKINLIMSRYSDNVREVILESGLKIKATQEHPFFTKQGMKPIASLLENEEVAVNLFEGVNSEEKVNEKEAITAKILGYMFGDGCLYETNGKLQGALYGNREDLETIKKDLERIGVNSNIYSRNRNHKIKTKYGEKEFNATNHELHIHSKKYKELLNV